MLGPAITFKVAECLILHQTVKNTTAQVKKYSQKNTIDFCLELAKVQTLPGARLGKLKHLLAMH